MNNNLEQNKSKIYIDVGNNLNNINNNPKNQINYKNINTTQTDKTLSHNKKYIQYIKPLLFLLQKAEQIISIINLPSSSIDKYNQLKEISFKKCGLEYTPLVKNNSLIKNFQKENDNNINNNNNIELNKSKNNKIIQGLSTSKNKLLDLILTFIETNNIMNINSNKNNKENKSLLNNSNDFNTNCNLLKEEINNLINEKTIIVNSTSENQLNSEENLIFREKEKIINYITRAQENVISVLYENDKKFNELKEAFLIQNSKNEYANKYISNIDELISPIWNKYYNNEVDWFNPNKIIDNYELKTYTKCHFLLNFMNQLFTDNKNLMEALTEMEKKKNEAFNLLQLPYIRKVIEKSEYLRNIEELLGKLNDNINKDKDKDKNKEMDMKKLISDGNELINCIKETIMEEPEIQKGDNITLKDGNNNNDLYNNYNDDMNLFLGKLMNGIQNILNKVDISIKKDELIESMIKVNMSKNKNISVENSIANMNNINNTNTNLNSTNVNINMSNANLNNITAINNGTASKDISFISTNNNDINNSKIQNMSFQSFQVYKKKTNHISGSNVIINSSNNNFNKSDIEYSEKKISKFGINDVKNGEIKKKIINNIMNVKEKENKKEDDVNLNKDKNIDNIQGDKELNDKILIQSINNIINDKKNDDKNNNDKNCNDIKEINNEDIINEEKSITVGDIGNNLSDLENSQKMKNSNSPKEENNIKNYINNNNINKEDDITDEGLEKLKNMVLEDFKSRLNEEKEKENDGSI